jgi:uncharacterized protein HemY
LGDVLMRQGDYVKARPLFEQAAADLEKALGRQNPRTQMALHHLSHLLLRTGRPNEAHALSTGVLLTYDKVLGSDHAWTKTSARLTADALEHLARPEEAKALREKYGLTQQEEPQAS